MGVDGFWENQDNTTSQHNHKVKTEGAAILLQESEIQNNDRGLGKCRQQQTNVNFVEWLIH